MTTTEVTFSFLFTECNIDTKSSEVFVDCFISLVVHVCLNIQGESVADMLFEHAHVNLHSLNA